MGVHGRERRRGRTWVAWRVPKSGGGGRFFHLWACGVKGDCSDVARRTLGVGWRRSRARTTWGGVAPRQRCGKVEIAFSINQGLHDFVHEPMSKPRHSNHFIPLLDKYRIIMSLRQSRESACSSSSILVGWNLEFDGMLSRSSLEHWNTTSLPDRLLYLEW